MGPPWLFSDPAAQRARARNRTAPGRRRRPAGLQADALRVPWHRGIAAQAAFAAPREPAARLVHGRPLHMYRVDANSAARHAETTGNVC